MASLIKIKRSATSGKRPTLEQVALGELALNTYDGYLFTERDTGGVGIGTTVTLLTPWTENYGAGSIYYQNNVGIGTTNTYNVKLSVDGTVKVTGISTFTGNIDANGNLDVDGHTELDNLNVSGVSTFQSSVNLGDNDRLKFGDDGDFEIYHAGTFSVIKDTSGTLVYRSGTHSIKNQGSTEDLATFNANGSVELYYDNNKKFETTGAGVTVYGTTQTQQLNVSGVSTLGITTFTNITSQQLNVTGVTTFSDDLTIGSNTVETDINILGSRITYTDVVGGYGNEPTKFYASNLSGTKNFVISVNHNTSSQQGGLLIRNATDTVAEFQHVPNTYTDFHPTPHCFEVYGGSIQIRNDREEADYLQAPPTLSLWNRVEGSSFTPGDEIHRIDFVAQDASGPGSGTIIRIADVINDTTGADHSLKFFTSDTPNGSPLTTSLSLGPKATELYYLGSKKFETTGAGVTVYGTTQTQQLNVSGVSTLGTVKISSGIITATSGVVTYYGDGQYLDLTNSVALGGDTTGDYVQSITGTPNEVEVTGGSGESSTPQIGLPNNVTIGQDLTITRDLQVTRNLNVDGNITIGGTSATLFTQTLQVADADLILGIRTDSNGEDISTDNTANHGGIAIASTEGTPLVTLVNPGAGETLPSTYKKIMWFKSGSFSGLGTDAWLSNYAIGIGSTQVPDGVRLAAGGVQITENDISVVRDINASGIATLPTIDATNATIDNLTFTSGTAITSVDTDLTAVSSSDDTLASAKAIKTYVDTQVTAQDLDFAGDSGTGAVDLDTQSFSIFGTTNEIETVGSGQSITIGLPNVVAITTSLTVGDATGITGVSTFFGDVNIGTGATTAFFDVSNGRVGIGFTNPNAKFVVKGDSGSVTAQFIQNDNTVAERSIIAQSTSGQNFGAYVDSSNRRHLVANQNDILTSNNNYLTLHTNSGIERLRITSDGDVGIGTDSPLGKLHLSDTNHPLVIDDNSASVDQGIVFTTAGSSDYKAAIRLTPGGSDKGLRFMTGGYINSAETVRITSDGNVGINTTQPTEKLDVIGTVKAIDFDTTSDQNLKTNIKIIEDPLEKIVQIRGVNFEWKENNKPSAGVIAQEVEKVLPELVTNNGTRAVNYNGLIGLLVEAVKAQQKEIDILKSKIK